MASTEATLEDIYAKLAIEEEEDEEIVITNKEVVKQKPTYMLVGKFLTDKNINFQVMKNLMASLWRPREGMEFHDMGDMKYSFIFFHKLDMQKVLEGGPWSFEQSMLVLHQVPMGEDPCTAQLQEMEIWVQIHDIPRDFISKNILKSIGTSMGKYIKSAPGTYEGGWKPYVRIRVTMNINKPLKRRMKIKLEGNSSSWINFKYEKLGTFCFVCGIIGHSERNCAIVYANPDKQIDKAYGTWLRAQSRGAKPNVGSRWIRNTGGGEGTWSNQKHQEEASNNNGEQQGGVRFMEIEDGTRVIDGEVGDIIIRPRDLRMQHTRENYVQNERENYVEGYKESNGENVITESKRKRIENIFSGENSGMEYMQRNEKQQQEMESMNLIQAGPDVGMDQDSNITQHMTLHSKNGPKANSVTGVCLPQ